MVLEFLYCLCLLKCCCLCISSQQHTRALLSLIALGQSLLHPPILPILGHLALTQSLAPGTQRLAPALLSIKGGTARQTEVPVRILIECNHLHWCGCSLICCDLIGLQIPMERIHSLHRRRRSLNKMCPPLNPRVPQVLHSAQQKHE